MKRWNVKKVVADEESTSTNKSILFLTINPNTVQDDEERQYFEDVIEALTNNLDKFLLLKQGDILYPYSELEPLLVGEIDVEVKFEIGPRFRRDHCHITIIGVVNNRNSMMFLDLEKIRAYGREQLGYEPYVDAKGKGDNAFNMRRYIRK